MSTTRSLQRRSTEIRRRRLYEEVMERLEAQINDGVYAPGTELPAERVLMQEFGVGRPAIREALFALQKMGLLHLSPGERPRVREPSGDIILQSVRGAVNRFMTQQGGLQQFQRARIFFEAGLAREAALCANAGDLAALEAALAENRAALDNPRRFEETDVAFHFCLAKMARNTLFLAMHDAMFDWLYTQRRVTLAVGGQALVALQAHEKIMKAIVKRNPDRAEAEMRAHLEQGHKLYWDVVRQADFSNLEGEALAAALEAEAALEPEGEKEAS